jgi:hypothetical protein
MRILLLMPLLALLVAAAPLTDSQQARLDNADDASSTVDEAAFYALLENAAEWTPGEAGATIPDYAAMQRNPAAWRGKLCLIEGVLLSRLPERKLARTGWDQVRGLVIQVAGFDKPRKQIGPEDMVIVYLTDPPTLNPPKIQLDPNMLAETGSKIRLVARFFKVLNEKNTRNESRLYLTFVGNSVAKLERDQSGASQFLPLILAAFVILGGYALIRILRKGKGMFASSNQLAEHIARKRAEREAEGADEIEPEDEDLDLPENPGDALDTLAAKHRENDQSL